jgi:hypothetical protein
VDNPYKEESRIGAAQVLMKEKVGKGKNGHYYATQGITSFSADPVDHGRYPRTREDGRKRKDSHQNADVQFGTPEV